MTHLRSRLLPLSARLRRRVPFSRHPQCRPKSWFSKSDSRDLESLDHLHLEVVRAVAEVGEKRHASSRSAVGSGPATTTIGEPVYLPPITAPAEVQHYHRVAAPAMQAEELV